jgi:DNA-binding HxlR family transcriptional regulator
MKTECTISKASNILGSKWTLEMIYFLQQPLRFCELQDELGGINPATLSQRLKSLEAEQIISRHVFDDSQRHVEYELTPKGKDLVSLYEHLTAWISRWYPEEAK